MHTVYIYIKVLLSHNNIVEIAYAVHILYHMYRTHFMAHASSKPFLVQPMLAFRVFGITTLLP
jgi:hypothetical protein